MKFRRLSPVLGALIAAPALALASTPMNLTEAVAFMHSQFPGDIVAAELDTTGDKSPHYHVDIRFPHGALARLELDALTRKISSRQPPVEPEDGAMSLTDTIAFISTQFPGKVMLAELDGSDATNPHYHVDMRLINGRTARLRIDPVTRLVSWRGTARLDF